MGTEIVCLIVTDDLTEKLHFGSPPNRDIFLRPNPASEAPFRPLAQI